MRFVRRIALFWYDFIVGDDWFLAVGVLVALGAVWLLAHNALSVLAWLVMPFAAVIVLGVSLWRAGRAD